MTILLKNLNFGIEPGHQQITQKHLVFSQFHPCHEPDSQASSVLVAVDFDKASAATAAFAASAFNCSYFVRGNPVWSTFPLLKFW